jgi:hypothetical protein
VKNNHNHNAMAGLVPAIHAFAFSARQKKAWMPGMKPGMTTDSSENMQWRR